MCNPIDSSPPDSSVPGILQARILEWVAISSSNVCMHAKSPQSCPTLCDPMDSSPPGSFAHRILQGKITGVDCHFLLQKGPLRSIKKNNLSSRVHPIHIAIITFGEILYSGSLRKPQNNVLRSDSHFLIIKHVDFEFLYNT